MASFTPRTSEYTPKSMLTYKTFTTYSWNHFAPETSGNCTWFAFGETSRIVQECLNDESYNIQYTYGNEFMSSGPNALMWMNNARNKGAWQVIGDSRGNSDPAGSPLYNVLIGVRAGDILCYWSSDGFGHVEVLEKIENGYAYCSGSKYGVQSPAVFYYSRTVLLDNFRVGKRHYFSGLDADGNPVSWSNDYFQGIIRNPYVSDGPTPPTPSVTPTVTVSPSSASLTMQSIADYVDVTFIIKVSGIPIGEDAGDGQSFVNCARYQIIYGWNYTTYTVGGVTYQEAERKLIVRYFRQNNYAYTDTAYMNYYKVFSNGTASNSTPIYITIQKKSSDGSVPIILKKRKKRWNIMRE